MLTVFSRPLLTKPRPRSAAIAMPWTPGAGAISPTTASLSMSITTTFVAWDTYSRRAAASTAR